MPKFYLRVEAVNLSNFVYDTGDLSTIRGGGLLLLNFPAGVPTTLQNCGAAEVSTIATGASIGIFSFVSEREKAAKISDSVLRELQRDDQLKHATFVADVVPARDDFVVCIEELTALNRWRQMQSPRVVVPALTESRDFCQIDLVNPASGDPIYKGTDLFNVSESVRARRAYGIDKKFNFYRGIVERVRKRHVELWSTYQDKFLETRFSDFEYGASATSDFHELADFEKKAGNANRKLAVIHIDGNGFGQLRSRYCQSEKLYRNFSRTLRERQDEFLVDLLMQMGAQGRDASSATDPYWFSDKGRARIETLLWGGDELTFVVPAWKGFELLEVFYRNATKWKLEESSAEVSSSPSGVPVIHAAGVVFCHDTAPIQRMTALAGTLTQIAKDADKSKDLIAYQVLESFDIVSTKFVEYRKKSISRAPGVSEFDMLLSADSLPEILQLGRHRGKLEEEIPRGKLHDFVRGTKETSLPPEEFAIELEKAVARCGKELSQHLDRAFGPNNARWLHLLELWDYLPQPFGGD